MFYEFRLLCASTQNVSTTSLSESEYYTDLLGSSFTVGWGRTISSEYRLKLLEPDEKAFAAIFIFCITFIFRLARIRSRKPPFALAPRNSA